MAGSPQWHAEQPYVQKCFSRAGMSDLLLTTSIQEVWEATGHFNTLCVYCNLYHFKNDHQANFPPLSFSCFLAFWQNAVVLRAPTPAMLTELWEALCTPGYLFLPGTSQGIYCLPLGSLEFPHPPPMPWETSHFPFLPCSRSAMGFHVPFGWTVPLQ